MDKKNARYIINKIVDLYKIGYNTDTLAFILKKEIELHDRIKSELLRPRDTRGKS